MSTLKEGRAARERDGRAALADVIRGRRSIDLFDAEPVGTAELLEAIELARWAPNHRLTEPWRFYVIGPETSAALARFGAEFDAERKGRQAGEARLARLKSIPGFFVLTCRRSEDELLQREDYAACCCAAQNLMLYLWQCGIGSKWTTGGMTRERRFYEIVGIDAAAELVVGFFWYGRPRVVPSQKRKSLGELVVERP
ncbi:MAG TPA: nitroreductase [Gammaproteobacteria bacterium]|nr:nitroreductase [Gammaproteobacteria bacterium]